MAVVALTKVLRAADSTLPGKWKITKVERGLDQLGLAEDGEPINPWTITAECSASLYAAIHLSATHDSPDLALLKLIEKIEAVGEAWHA